MLVILIEAAILVTLLKAIVGDDVGYLTAFLIALGASIGTTLLAIGLASAMGIAGVLLAVVIAAALLGVVVSALFGAEIMRSFLVAGVFMATHVCLAVAFNLMLPT